MIKKSILSGLVLSSLLVANVIGIDGGTHDTSNYNSTDKKADGSDNLMDFRKTSGGGGTINYPAPLPPPPKIVWEAQTFSLSSLNNFGTQRDSASGGGWRVVSTIYGHNYNSMFSFSSPCGQTKSIVVSHKNKTAYIGICGVSIRLKTAWSSVKDVVSIPSGSY